MPLMQTTGFPENYVQFNPSLLNQVNISSLSLVDAVFIEISNRFVQFFVMVEAHPVVDTNPMTFDIGLPVDTPLTRLTDVFPIVTGGFGQLQGTFNPGPPRVMNMSALENTGLDIFGPLYWNTWLYAKAS